MGNALVHSMHPARYRRIARLASFSMVAFALSVQPAGAQPFQFHDGFESAGSWQTFDEQVNASPCYGLGGLVVPSPEVAHRGSQSLKVHANPAKSPLANHLIAYNMVSGSAASGPARYQAWVYQEPARPGSVGETGPEVSVQSTKSVGNAFITSIAGVQYLANPADTDKYQMWNLWQQIDNIADWQPLVKLPIERATWYLLTIEANFTTNKYTRFSLKGGSVDTTIDLSSFTLGSQDKKFTNEATVLTLEAENASNNCGAAAPTDFAMFYDDVAFWQPPPPPPPPPADFNADGRSDISVFRPSSNQWYVQGQAPLSFGLSFDVPVPANYDDNGSVDMAVYRPSVGGWYVQGRSPVFLGLAGDVAVPADYNGDGRADPTVFRPSVGGWYRNGAATTFYGLSGDIPVPADYDGDGWADLAVFRPSVGGWYRDGAPVTFLGLLGDIPVPGDYDGDGITDIAVFRPSVGGWYIEDRPPVFLGLAGDIPVPADYDGDSDTDMAVFRPSTGAWFIAGQPPVYFGLDGDRPLPLPSAIREPFFP